MPRTIFTAEDVKNLWQSIFNGVDVPQKQEDGSIATVHQNPNSETLLFRDEDGDEEERDLAEYLGIKFYTWKERLVDTKDDVSAPPYSVFDDWVKSIEFSMDKAYALVELIDEEVTTSQDIDNAVKAGRITFLIQSDKVKNFDYYVNKLRNIYIGNPNQITNSYGDKVTAYLLLGILVYDEEPTTIQYGECVRVSAGFKISYLSDALNYSDQTVEISLDGDDLYDEDGAVIGETKFLTVPITRQTWQAIFSANAVPTSSRPDLTGFLATTLSVVKTLTFFEFNKALTLRFNELFWRCGAYRVDGALTKVQDVNIPVYVRVTTAGHSYVFKDMIDNMQKVITNSDFNISSITLKGWGKLGYDVSPPPPPPTFSVKYGVCGGEGEVFGNTDQKVVIGGNATPVTASPAPGWTFAKWSDDKSGATRQDINITSDVNVCAQFEIAPPEPVEKSETFPYKGIVFDVTTTQIQVAPEPYGSSEPLDADKAEVLEYIGIPLSGTPLDGIEIVELKSVSVEGYLFNDYPPETIIQIADYFIEGNILFIRLPLATANTNEWYRIHNQTSAGNGPYENRRSKITVTFTTFPEP